MRKFRTHTIAALVAAILGPGLETGASTPGEQFTVSLQAAANPVQGTPLTLCQASEETGPHKKIDWWVAFGELKPREGTVAVGDPFRGGCGSVEKTRVGFEKASKNSYLLARISTSARFVHEGPLALKASLSLRKFAGFDADGQPIYQESTDTREFYFSQDSPDATIPILLANHEEQEALGVREVFLKLEAGVVGERASPIGRVLVISDRVGADLLLDGGVIGQVTADQDTILHHVPVGLREVRTREPSGKQAHRVVRVLPGRTVSVDLSLPRRESGNPYGLVSIGKNAQGHEEYRRARDGAVVVKIPAGDFVMGNPKTEREPLEHPVYVSEFLIDKTAVTWGRYQRFAAAAGIALPPEPFWGRHDDHPVVFVTWEEGRAYCEWAGGRLPTEAEREKAARGTDKRMYPWGNEKPDAERAVHRRSWGFEATDPVGTHPSGASPYGVLDIAGNVWEWCSDWYDVDYYSVSPRRDPRGPNTGIAHVVRGGSWDSRPDVLSCSCRSFGNIGYAEGDFGFRCAMNAPR